MFDVVSHSYSTSELKVSCLLMNGMRIKQQQQQKMMLTLCKIFSILKYNFFFFC